MVFGPIKKYSLVNAKVRARLGQLLSTERIERLARTRNPQEFYAALNGTVYEEVFSDPEINVDPRYAEKLLFRKEIIWHAELIQDLRGEIRDLVAQFVEKYEIENIKAALRARRSERGEEVLRYIVKTALPNRIPYISIYEADTVEEALLLLSGTPYLQPAMSALDDYNEKKNLFPIETAMEIDYYRRLEKKVQKLSGRDRKIAAKLIGLEIDQKNIEWLVRLKFYYDIPVADLLDYNIPGGASLGRQQLMKIFQADSVEELLTAAFDHYLGQAAMLFSKVPQAGKLYVMEIILWDYLVREARRTLGGFPFTIGTVLSYLILKRAEIRNLITILNGKVIGLDHDAIDNHLRILF
jgi:ATP synthase A1 C subunit